MKPGNRFEYSLTLHPNVMVLIPTMPPDSGVLADEKALSLYTQGLLRSAWIVGGLFCNDGS
ncbi:hypothetical protein C173_02334 [Paenibacillus sp. FSL R7-277]|uniref:Uncharacterized protein n=1 Tax=Paenibacillus silagei TaxID=1670801 RepID=A0ABS4NUH9_9BACL|nr:hypothetical protein C173_02334 [Paenibacillus sp. FSL R7-277]MBP2113718.1 hypothetical protein [Paenibacillus silagei]